MGRLERDLERRCDDHADSEGWEYGKLEKAKRGWPDKIYFGPNSAMLIVEYKLPGEPVRKQQAAVHRRFERLGQPVSVVTSYEQFVSLLADESALALSLTELFPKLPTQH